MAKKSRQKNNQPIHTAVKYVRKAHQWVKTTWDGNKYHQDWSSEKPK